MAAQGQTPANVPLPTAWSTSATLVAHPNPQDNVDPMAPQTAQIPYQPYNNSYIPGDVNEFRRVIFSHVDFHNAGLGQQAQNALMQIATNICDIMYTTVRRNARDAVTHHHRWLDNYMSGINTHIQNINATNTRQDNAFAHLQTVLNAQPGGQTGRIPKIPDPTKFKGGKDETFEDWLNQINLWIAHQRITDDRQKMVIALGAIEGPPAKFMSDYYEKVSTGQNMGTWVDFLNQLKATYGNKDKVRGANDELENLFRDKHLASSNFLTFMSQVRALAKIGTLAQNEEYMITKLREVIPTSMRQTLAGYEIDKNVTSWEAFADTLLKLYKLLYPDKAKEVIFKKNTASSGDSMEVDKVSKKEKTRAVTTKSKTGKWCDHHKTDTHNTADCRAKQASGSKDKGTPKTPQKKKDGKKKGEKGKSPGNKRYPSKKVRALASDEEDDEEESSSSDSDGASPPPKKSHKAKGKRREKLEARIVEVLSDSDEDPEPIARASTGQPFSQKDFYSRFL